MPNTESLTKTLEPQIATPHVYIEELSRASEAKTDGLIVSRWLIEHSTPISFPATDPSTLINDSKPDSEIFTMRYTGPNFFNLPDAPSQVRTLEESYNRGVSVWRNEFGIETEALGYDGRAAEAFITNMTRGEKADPHRDTYQTCAGYPAAGAALIVSHRLNARDIEDIRDQPATLVLPRAQSLVFFDGANHPHAGVNPNIQADDPPEIKRSKFYAMFEQFKIVSIVQNLNGSHTEPTTVPELLTSWPELEGDRPVISLNFSINGAGSSLDKFFVNATR